MMKRWMARFSLVILLGISAASFAGPKKPMIDENMMMAKMMKYGAPGPNHKVLGVFVGQWVHTRKMENDPRFQTARNDRGK